MDLVLASASPRRAALLRQAGLSFRVMPAGVNESNAGACSDPAGMVVRLARAKAGRVAARLKTGVVIGADTMVVHRGEVLGKPRDRFDARQMLLRLSGCRHSVLTGLALVDVPTGRIEESFTETRVWMRALETELIDAYVATDEPMDKAGAYGIQGKAALFVEKIEGCYFNVVGLPLNRLYLLLSRMEINPWSSWGDGGDTGRAVDD